MKAAVMYQNAEVPEYANVKEPVSQNENEVLVTVKAVSLKHFDRHRAMGRHYSAERTEDAGRIIGSDGICLLEDGTRVYGMGSGGMLAEKALIDKSRMVKIPDGLDDATAAALPNAVIGAAMGLKFKAGMQPGDTVLVNGATGFTGRVAVQLAKYYGAGRIIATGRNQKSLDSLLSLGADEIITIKEGGADFTERLNAIHNQTPVDVVIDYLWGPTAEIILGCLKGDGSFTNRIRYVSVGSMGGDLVQLSAAILRSADLQLTGSGLGSWPKEQVQQLFTHILPEMFQLAAEGRLVVDTQTIAINDIAQVWNTETSGGQRLVVTI